MQDRSGFDRWSLVARLLAVACVLASLFWGRATQRIRSDSLTAGAAAEWMDPTPPDGEVVGQNAVTLRAVGTTADATGFFDFDGTLAGYWPIENVASLTTLDESPHGNTATLVGRSGRADVGPGRFGNGIQLNGQGERLQIPNAAAIDITGHGLTLAVWVRPTFNENAAADQFVFDKRDGGPASYGLGFDANARSWRFTLTTSTGSAACDAPRGLIVPGNWYHLAARYDGSVMEFFIDGVRVAACAHSGDIVGNAGPLLIGGISFLGFGGMIDEAVILTRPLENAEIAQLAGHVGDGISATFADLAPGRHAYGLYYVDEPGNLVASRRDLIYDPTPLTLVLSQSVFPASRTCRKVTRFVDQCPDPFYASFTLTYQLGAYTELKKGSVLQVTTAYRYNGKYLLNSNANFAWPAPQSADPTAPNFISARVIGNPYGTTNVNIIDLPAVRAARLKFQNRLGPGTVIEIQYGDQLSGSPGQLVPAIAYDSPLVVEQDANADGVRTLVNTEMPVLRVVGTELDTFAAVVPSITKTGQVEVTVQALQGQEDMHTNMYIVHGYRGTIHFSSTDPLAELPEDYTFRAADDGVRTFSVRLASPGVQRVFVYEVNSNKWGVSNPGVVVDVSGDRGSDLAAEDRDIYWGTLHQHTNVGGHALQTSEFAYNYARHVSALNFLALSEHCAHSGVDWNQTLQLTNDYYVPGEFVTFAAIEWTARHYGHRHLLYLNPQDVPGCEGYNPTMNSAPTVDEMLTQAEGKEVIAVLHHFAWRFSETPNQVTTPGAEVGDIDYSSQKLYEIYSHHGSSERYDNDPYPIHNDQSRATQWPPSKGVYFQDVIEDGYRFGVTADGDNHTGEPGGHVSTMRDDGLYEQYTRNGLTAVYADELTRESLWEAFLARRTYGTTGARIILSFKMNGHYLGEEFSTNDTPQAHIEVIGTNMIDKVEIYRNGRELVFSGSPQADTAEFDFTDGNVTNGEVYSYYVRVRQVDDHFAWSSPIWIQYTGETHTTMPLKAALRQNTPNPFNPKTTIPYDVPIGGGMVSLRIYDVGGRLVTTLVNGPEAAGTKNVEWDGTAGNGRTMASGIYFYKLVIDEFVESKKMVLMK